jgi:hypothetical protein
MRKIVFLLLLISSVAKGQIPNYSGLGGGYWYRDRVAVSGTLTIPAGTNPALSTGGWVAAGAVFVDTVGGNKGFWVYWDGVWHKMVDTTYTGFTTSANNGATNSSGVIQLGSSTPNASTFTSNRYINTNGDSLFLTSRTTKLWLGADSSIAGGAAFIELKGPYGGAINFRSDTAGRTYNGFSWYKKGHFSGTIGHDVDSAQNTNHLFFDDSHDSYGFKFYAFEFGGTSSLAIANTGVTYMGLYGSKRVGIGLGTNQVGANLHVKGTAKIGTDSVYLFSRLGSNTDSIYTKRSDGTLGAIAPSSITTTNIYNSDGVLTDNRTLTGTEYSYGLTMSALAYFNVETAQASGKIKYGRLSEIGTGAYGIAGSVDNFISDNSGVAINSGDSSAYIFGYQIGSDKKFGVKKDSLYSTFSKSSSSLTGYNLLARNTATGAIVDYTGSVGGGLTVGTSAITSGTNGRVLYDNSGVLGEYAVGSGMSTWWATPSSANLAAAVTDETGSGALAFATTPTFTTNITTPIVNGSASSNGTLTLQGNNAGSGNTSTNANIIAKVGNTPTQALDILNNGLVRIGSGPTTTSGYGLVVDQPDDGTDLKGVRVSANNHTAYMEIGYDKIQTSGANKIGAASGGVQLYGASGASVNISTSAAAPTSTLTVDGSIGIKYASKSADYTLTATDYGVEVTATGKTITLPTAASIAGRMYTIKLTASGSATVATTSSQTIDGSTTYSLSAQYKYVTVMSNGSNWIIIANN